jgi:hypothetical protein
MFWVISVYFNIRNTLPKSGTFLLGHPVCIYIYIYCATNQKIAVSIPDVVMEFFIDINRSDRTMALGSTQPLTEMSTKSISWG